MTEDGAAAMRRALGWVAAEATDQHGVATIPAEKTYIVPARRCDVPLPDTVWIVDPAEPYGMTLRLPSSTNQHVDWWIGRDLLAEGLEFPAGIADIRVERITDDELPCGDWLRIELDSPSGHAVILTDAWPARVAIALSYRHRPPGRDVHVDDLELACWIAPWAI